jgi:heptosyltransferase-2
MVESKKILIIWYSYIWHADTVIEKLCRQYPNFNFFVLAKAEAMCAIAKNPNITTVKEYRPPLNLIYGLRLLKFIRKERFDRFVILIPTLHEIIRRREQILAVMSEVPRRELFGMAECSIRKVTIVRNLVYIVSEFLSAISRRILRLLALGFVSLRTVKGKKKLKKLLLSNHFKKVLVINYSPALGNTIVVTPFLNAIKERFPWIQIILLVSSKTKEIFESNKTIYSIIPYDFYHRPLGVIEKPVKQGLKNKLKLLRQLRNEDIDLCIDVEPHEESLVLTSLAGIRFRLGSLYKKEQINCFTASVLHPWIESRKNGNWAGYVLELAKFLDIDIAKINRHFNIEIDDDSIKWSDAFLRAHCISNSDTVICIHPGTGKGWLNKQWGSEKFAKLIQILTTYNNVKPVIIGTSDEEELASKIAELSQTKPILAVGKTSIKQLAALIKRCDFLICNNSGVMHIASAVGTPIIAICGPSSFIWNPAEEGNVIIRNNMCWPPCDSRICKRQDMGCMEAITVGDVLEAVETKILRVNR